MEFVLALHTHLPYVLNHGRWPHGSDWLTEATLDTYLPMLEALLALEAEGTPTPATIGITPVLANQLASPDLVKELETFFDQRLAASREAPAQLEAEGSGYLVPVAKFWEERILRLRRFYESIDGDMTGAFRGLAERGRIELISSAATHGFLPMLGAEHSPAARLRTAGASSDFRRRSARDLAAGMRVSPARTMAAVRSFGVGRTRPARHRRASRRFRLRIFLH
jgi:1,4-alpha-glucan branching enzyme